MSESDSKHFKVKCMLGKSKSEMQHVWKNLPCGRFVWQVIFKARMRNILKKNTSLLINLRNGFTYILHWHLDKRMIAPVPVKERRRIWMKLTFSKPQHSANSVHFSWDEIILKSYIFCFETHQYVRIYNESHLCRWWFPCRCMWPSRWSNWARSISSTKTRICITHQ